jgi:hypothetical protein
MDPQINLDGSKFHKTCAKCGECGCQITLSNFTKNESNDQTMLLCKIHYFKRFHEGGSYVGGDKYRTKSQRDIQSALKLDNLALDDTDVAAQQEQSAVDNSSTDDKIVKDTVPSNVE